MLYSGPYCWSCQWFPFSFPSLPFSYFLNIFVFKVLSLDPIHASGGGRVLPFELIIHGGSVLRWKEKELRVTVTCVWIILPTCSLCQLQKGGIFPCLSLSLLTCKVGDHSPCFKRLYWGYEPACVKCLVPSRYLIKTWLLSCTPCVQAEFTH